MEGHLTDKQVSAVTFAHFVLEVSGGKLELTKRLKYNRRQKTRTVRNKAQS